MGIPPGCGCFIGVVQVQLAVLCIGWRDCHQEDNLIRHCYVVGGLIITPKSSVSTCDETKLVLSYTGGSRMNVFVLAEQGGVCAPWIIDVLTAQEYLA